MNNQTSTKVKEIYQQRTEFFTALVKRLRKKLLVNSLIRLIIFVGIVLSLYFYIKFHFLPIIISLFVLIISFALLLRRHQYLKNKVAVNEQLNELNKKELYAMQYDHSVFIDTGNDLIEPTHDFLTDLDIFGEGSLFQMINRTCSVDGREHLAQSLKNNTFDPDTIINNQYALLELETMLEWRQLFYANGSLNTTGKTDRENFFVWLDEPIKYLKNGMLRLIAYLIPVMVIISFILLLLNLISFSIFSCIFLIPLTITGLDLKRINRIHGAIGKRSEFLKTYGVLIRMIEDQNFNSSVLTGIQNQFFSENLSASQQIRKLSSIMNAFDSRLNIVVGLLLNGFFMWDHHCLFRLEKWKIQNKSSIQRWFQAIGEKDSLNSFANFNYNNPSYCVPQINSSDQYILEGNELGHPLIPYNERISNNFTITKLKTFVIITGANMSGKSTFLRTLGINMILASAGTRVCSSHFIHTPITIYTSMRTTDSLYRHESYFYAELRRLQLLLNRLKASEKIFIFLDEILKGTNSVDKLQGSIAFLKQLLELNCAGIIATHDLSLTDLENEFPDQIQNMCFEIEIKDSEIFFDYKLLQGVTKKMNALLLMKQMGLIGT